MLQIQIKWLLSSLSSRLAIAKQAFNRIEPGFERDLVLANVMECAYDPDNHQHRDEPQEYYDAEYL
jgi:hypothetical protein